MIIQELKSIKKSLMKGEENDFVFQNQIISIT